MHKFSGTADVDSLLFLDDLLCGYFQNMTTIDKVALCGVRSYDPNGLVVIKFFKPLTIILGNNGCGKTSIIESLKVHLSIETTHYLIRYSKSNAYCLSPFSTSVPEIHLHYRKEERHLSTIRSIAE